jgi:D-sedoheptulose 7-phosphate isomerase
MPAARANGIAPPTALDIPGDRSKALGAVLAAELRGRSTSLSSALHQLAVASDRLAAAAATIVESLACGHMVLACGNGGSAAEAQHFVGELVGRFLREREPWPAMALSADHAVLTAIANDYGYEAIFARQVAAFGRPGDVLVAFSTSGKSPNVVRAAQEARQREMRVIALTGCTPGPLGELADVVLAAPVAATPLVQEIHTILVHLVCETVESHLTAGATARVERQ